MANYYTNMHTLGQCFTHLQAANFKPVSGKSEVAKEMMKFLTVDREMGYHLKLYFWLSKISLRKIFISAAK